MLHVTGLVLFGVLWLIALAGFVDAFGPVVRRLRIMLPTASLPKLPLQLPAIRELAANRV